jgi:PEGA domain-containing protein
MSRAKKNPLEPEGLAMPFRRNIAFVLGLLAAAALTERPAWAQSAPPGSSPASPRAGVPPPAPSADVRQDVEAGRQYEADKDYGSAWLRFSHANDAAHDPTLLVEMARCEKGMQQFARAARHLEQAFASSPQGLTSAQTVEAHELYNTLLPSLGHVRVSVDPPGATVAVDDVPAGQAPLSGDVLIDPGDHGFRVTKTGYVEFRAVLSAAGGSQKLLDVKLQPAVQEGHVRIHTSPHNTVVLDGVVGYGNWDGRVAAGSHSLTISAPGMHSFEPDLVVVPNKTSTFDVTLQPDTGGPVGLWVAGGAVVVATVVVAVLSVFHPEPAPAPH